jgi:thiol-disulfide isomerase/thioredoxin
MINNNGHKKAIMHYTSGKTNFFRKIVLCFVLSAIFASTSAQQNTFSGVWLLKEHVSLSGTDYSNALSQRLGVEQVQSGAVIERVSADENNKEFSTFDTITFNGNQAESLTKRKRKRVAVADLTGNQGGFREIIKFYKAEDDAQIDFTITENWRLSDSGKMLNIVKVFESATNPDDKWSVSGIYKRTTAEELRKDTATGAGIRFEEHSTWEQLMAKAKQEKKLIFVDCYASWCGPCKKMDKSVYVLNKVGEFVNARFVSVKIQMDITAKDNADIKQWHATGNEIMRKYKLAGYPSFLFFSPDGKIVHSEIGERDPDSFIILAKTAANPSSQYFTLLNKYLNEKKEYASLLSLSLSAKDRGNNRMAAIIAADYKKNYAHQEIEKDTGFINSQFLRFKDYFPELFSTKDKFFEICYQYPDRINRAAHNKNRAQQYLEEMIIAGEINPRIYQHEKPVKVDPDWDKMISGIKNKYPKIDVDRILLNQQIAYYDKKKDGAKYIKYFVEKVSRYGPFALGFGLSHDGAGGDNEITYAMLTYCSDKKILDKAIVWMDTLMAKSQSRTAFYGNYAGLLYKAGRIPESIGYMERVIENSKEDFSLKGESPSGDFYDHKRALLERMKKGNEIDRSWDISWFY